MLALVEKGFPVILCELRKEKGVSQKKAADELGISQALLSHYEKGIRECGQDFLLRAADYYNVTCDYLLGRSSSKSGFNEYYKAENALPTDNTFSDITLLRATVLLIEKLANTQPCNSVDYTMYLGIEVYRLLLNLASIGCIPKSWVADNDFKCLSPIFLGIINSACSTLAYTGKCKHIDDGEPVPPCIKTLSSVAYDYIIRTVAQDASIYHGK